MGDLAPLERKALAAISESADLLLVDDKAWLLVPADAWLVDTLAAFGAEAEDREPYLEDEPGADLERIVDDEPDVDAEPDHRVIRRPITKHRPQRGHGLIAIQELTPAAAARLLAKRER